MTREQKLALIMGFALVLVVGVLVSDHFSKAGQGDALRTDGIDTAVAGGSYEQPRQLLVNSSLIDNTFATPETAPAPAPNPDRGSAAGSSRGFFDQMREQMNDVAGDLGSLPTAAMRTEPRDEPAAIPEFKMGESNLTLDRRDGARIYRVKPDDNLWKIAQREYGDGGLYTRLAEFNHDRVGDGGTIREGASLLIPDREVLLSYERGDERIVEREGARSVPDRADTPRVRTRSYTVERGETLSEICQRELGSGKRWREVVELNDGAIPDDGNVRRGQTIILPAR
ncbi:MAG: LysM peptidoglycan-binding domain-containing protein [Planctomycetota bacterium]